MRHYVDLAEALDVTFNYSLLSCKYGDPEIDDLLPDDDELRMLANNLLELDSGRAKLQAPLGVNLTVSTNCGLASKEVSIDSDGEVYPCHLLQDPSMSLGNVFREALTDILAKDETREIAGLNVDDFEGCSECGHRYLCGGGCRARSYFRYGDLQSKDGYCAMMQTYFDGVGKRLKARFGE